MRLFLLPETFNGSSDFTLTGKEFNYLIRVLRLKENAALTGRDKDGGIWNLTLVSVSKNSCRLTAVKSDSAKETTDTLPQDRPCRNLVLYQCLPKGRKADEIIKRATEIGTRNIVLVKSKNCICELEGKENTRLERYETLIKEAIQQSGSLVPTDINGVLDISEVARDFKKRCEVFGEQGLGLLLHQCHLAEKQNDLPTLLKDFTGTVGILVGSEGGFTDEECKMLIDGDFKPVLLKTNILRCETAAIYALAAVQTLIETTCQ